MRDERLVADIGGTNARFALAREGMLDQASIRKYAVKNFIDFPSCLTSFCRDINLSARDLCGHLSAACLSVAGIVSDNSIHFTNNHWSIKGDELSQEYGVPFVLINDFIAMAYSASVASSERAKDLSGVPFTPNKDRKAIAVLGAGTGMGVAGGRWQGDLFVPFGGEGGHVNFAPINSEHLAIAAYLRSHLKLERLSIERILSGPGLLNLYSAGCALERQPMRSTKTEKLLEYGLNDPSSQERQALIQFCEILGDFAGDVALTYAAKGGVYLAGGLTQALGPFLKQSGFRDLFEAKGRMRPFMESISVSLLTDPEPGLRGAALASIEPSI